jgi:hypothetical protein
MLPADPEATGDTIVKEVTIKSFSTTRHIRRPGFQLLSLVSPTNLSPSRSTSQTHPQSFEAAPCFLPSHQGIYTSIYIPFAIFTLFALLVCNLLHKRVPSSKSTPQISISSRTSPHIKIRGRNSVPPPGSPGWQTWSPMSPFSPIHDSPNRSIPPSMRTPSLAPPTLRASSRPATPAGSPLLTPAFGHDEEDEHAQEDMRPTQYALRRDRVYSSGDWSPGHDDDDRISDSERADPDETPESPPSFFLPTSGSSDRSDWSWTFVFRGRRRRLTLHPASLVILRPIVRALTVGSRRRRSLIRAVLDDIISVGWVIVVSWVVFGWLID